MSSATIVSRDGVLIPIGLVVLSVVAGIGASVAPEVGIAIIAAIVFLAALSLLPRRYLGAAALALYVVIPVKFLKYPGDPGIVGPPLVALGVWLLRLALSKSRKVALHRLTSERSVLVLVALTTVAVVLALAVNPKDWVAFFWTVNFGLSILLAAVLIAAEPKAKLPIMATWEVLAVALGLFGLVEAYVWNDNPVFGTLYANASVPLNQVWNVYRITTSLGHPLVNGTFFAGGLIIAVGRLIVDRRPVHLVPAALSAIGIFLSGSRGPAIAAVIGSTALFVLSWRRREFGGPRMVVTALVVFVIGLVAATGVAADSPLLQRAAGAEAQSSFLYRQTTVTDGLALWLSHPIFGWGPGHADAVNRAISGPFGGGLENGWIELLASIGLAGLTPFVLLVVLAAFKAFTLGDPPASALVMTLIVAIASFNFFEGQWPSLILFGLALGCAFANDAEVAQTGAFSNPGARNTDGLDAQRLPDLSGAGKYGLRPTHR